MLVVCGMAAEKYKSAVGNDMKKLVLAFILCVYAFPALCGENIAELLKGKTVGVQLGTTGDILGSEIPGIKMERYNKGNDAVQSLLNKKIDAVIIDEQPAFTFVRKNEGLVILEQEFADEKYAIALSKKSRKLKEQINRVLSEMKADGTMEKIVQNYIGDATRGKFPYRAPENAVYPNGTLKVATSATFPPYEYYEEARIVGIDMDMARTIADRLGKKLVIEDMEFDSIIGAVQTGKADIGAAGMTVTEDRLKSVDFSQPYTESKQVVIMRGETTEKQEVSSFLQSFHNDFVKDARWKYLAIGLGHTLLITAFAAIIGIVFGGLMAVVRVSYEKNGSFPVLNALCRAYLGVIRGTPVMIQLLIMYYVIFSSVDVNKIIVAVLAFGLNSAAYVAEIVRSGIMSVDHGQLEAGRSLGMTFPQTMRFVVLPQAFKNVLPALANEFIALLKETSICGYIGLMDLTRGGDIIRSITYDAFLPLMAVALIYLSLVLMLTSCVDRLEKRMKKNER